MEKGLYGIPVVPSVEKEDRMSQTQDTIVAALMEQLIAEGPDGMAQVFTTLFNLAMRLERERFLGPGCTNATPIGAAMPTATRARRSTPRPGR